MEQQTAVEWLIKELDKYKEKPWEYVGKGDKEAIIIQAALMEKERIINAYRCGKVEANLPTEKFTTGEQYYNEIFKTK